MGEAKFQVFSLTEPGIRDHKKRKPHSKSREGCLDCKRKKVKCDETRPICKRCVRNNRSCLYQVSNSPSKDFGGSEPSQTGLVQVHRHSQSQRQRQHRRHDRCPNGTLTQPTYHLPLLVEFETPASGTSVNELLHHFNENYLAISETCFSFNVWHLACNHPYLLSAILAVSACHLRHHAPNPRPHEVAECYQQRLTLRGFQSDLTRNLDQDRSDALITTAIFLNLLSFALIDDPRPAASWVFSSSKDRLAWLSLQLGLKPLLMETAAFRDDSVLQPMFEASNHEKHTGLPIDLVDDADMIHMPTSWLGIFLPSTTLKTPDGRLVDTKIFQEPLRALAISRQIDPAAENIFIYLQFIGKLGPEFLDLLHERNERALWMFGYWLGLLGRFGCWWLRGRVHRDYNAILLLLHQQRQRQTYNDAREKSMWSVLMDDIEQLRSDWTFVSV